MLDEKREKATKTLKEVVENGPQFTRESPLDEAFKALYESIISKLNDSKTYQELGCSSNEEFVNQLLQHFGRIHDAACDKQRIDGGELLPISLHDMRYMDTLIKLILFHGLEANLPASARSQICPDELGCGILRSHPANPQTLIAVMACLYPIISDTSRADDYARMVVLRGPLYREMVLGLLHLFASMEDAQYEKMVDVLETVQQTYELLNVYTSLVDTIRDTELRAVLLVRLSTLPVRRNDGVLSLIDFVTGARESEQIDVEKVCRVTEILVAKPKNMSSVEYFTNLFEQVREQLSHINRPLVITCLNDLISTLYQKNSRIIQDFLFKPVFDVLYNMPIKNYTSKQLNDVTNVLISLTKSPSVEMMEALTSAYGQNQFYLHLWIYALFLRKFQTLAPIMYDKDGNKIEETPAPYYNVILSLIKSYMVLTNHFESLDHLALNLINFEHSQWKYVVDLQTQLVSITVKDEGEKLPRSLTTGRNERDGSFDLFKDIDMAVDLFVLLLNLIGNEEVTKNLFLNVLSRWVKSSIDNKRPDTLDGSESSALILVDLKILERMNKEFTSEIVKKPDDILLLILELLGSITEEEKQKPEIGEDSDDEEEEPVAATAASTIFDIVLELLGTVLDKGVLKSSSKAQETLQAIHEKLGRHENRQCEELRSKIHHLLNNTNISDLQTESSFADNQLLLEAMNNINDPIDPIKVQGLTTLARLAEKQSQVVQLPRFRAIFLQHLRYPDPFVYLNAVKGLAVLCERDPNETVDALLKIYLNLEQRHKIDDVLKIGESLSLYIQREGELFQGRNANNIVDACLAIVRKHDSLDNRIRMSAISLLGVCLRVNAIGIQDRIPLILDCVFGVLQLETTAKQAARNKNYKDAFVVRRAAIHLVFDLLNDNGFDLLPKDYNHGQLVVLLRYAREHDDDALVRKHADEILQLTGRLLALQI
ncbi:hypothetical protein HG536_0A08350 [Torulaspora globosa]|uniref:RNA polymerase II assembly factor Rtp1 C-terminal domain-containing protein n=1 Tax=Torulaspora globosa TaxID=48254 RepID=A0A7G3ZBY4_9SACH|nr:uncharacterized protein HG536_0A08350 [Torulaspora globosa]QLL31020.1 hypothetical protein HG536_0A08350 [Torulaspora globosa]